ncbi:hypothetical protein LEP1GSC036_1371 [Leptospira weilii str. 2006001853]|nr:hypothetical protein LEP1GSC036_1371 [Leptospira weilii str. 2006001853]EMN46046.1 hypothetical protein LEP1GSC086_2124 [Leptospira weilii str. LNT 1234]QDK21625.1 hypothetical protein FHG67_01750 [Leptospira weilii]QDK25590.1 hypothetical protein FHG68_01760 [Leptospira weilii]
MSKDMFLSLKDKILMEKSLIFLIFFSSKVIFLFKKFSHANSHSVLYQIEKETDKDSKPNYEIEANRNN